MKTSNLSTHQPDCELVSFEYAQALEYLSEKKPERWLLFALQDRMQDFQIKNPDRALVALAKAYADAAGDAAKEYEDDECVEIERNKHGI